jgi:parvulin-like peptidyl-prolyl isomerase
MSIHIHKAFTTGRFFHSGMLLCAVAMLWSALFSPCGCQKNDASETVATVNGEKITLDEFRKRLAGTLNYAGGPSSPKPEDDDRLREGVLNQLINEKIMLSRAAELSLTVSGADIAKKIEEVKEGYSEEGFEKVLAEQNINFDAWKRTLKKRMILEKLIDSDVNAAVSVTDEEVKEYYNSHRKDYVQGKKIHVAQIVFRNPELSGSILRRLKSGEDFGKVAREMSIGLEADRGGDMGFIGRGIMPEAIDDVIFSLRSGAISPIIKSPYGYHIFKVIEKEERRREFSDIKERVMADVRKQKEEQAYVLWISNLRSRAAIRIDRDLLRKGIVSRSRQAEQGNN